MNVNDSNLTIGELSRKRPVTKRGHAKGTIIDGVRFNNEPVTYDEVDCLITFELLTPNWFDDSTYNELVRAWDLEAIAQDVDKPLFVKPPRHEKWWTEWRRRECRHAKDSRRNHGRKPRRGEAIRRMRTLVDDLNVAQVRARNAAIEEYRLYDYESNLSDAVYDGYDYDDGYDFDDDRVDEALEAKYADEIGVDEHTFAYVEALEDRHFCAINEFYTEQYLEQHPLPEDNGDDVTNPSIELSVNEFGELLDV